MEHFRGDNSLKKQQRREERRRDRRRLRDNLYLLVLCALVCALYLSYVYRTYVEPAQVTAESATESSIGAFADPGTDAPAGSGTGTTTDPGTDAPAGSGSGTTDPGTDAPAGSGIGTTDPGTTSLPVCIAHPESIPDYAGQDVLELTDENTSFTEEELNSITGEHFSALDSLGRCGTVYAMLHRTMMPTGERGSIREIRPSGWKQTKYPGIVDSDPPYLWNRSHLIAYGMTGQTANECNLITGSRYMNATTMLPYEEEVMGYLRYSDNHVLYRVTPYFKGKELVARGVEMEACSVEDRGRGVRFHVFVYNVQPGIVINYQTGDSWKE